MNRRLPAFLALMLILSPALAAGRSGGGFGGRSMSSRSYSRPYSAPRPRTSTRFSAPRVFLAPRTVRASPSARPPVRTVIVHHTTYSSAFPYFYLGAYWPHPQRWYPAGTVFTDAPTPVQVAPANRPHLWVWLLLIAALLVLLVWLARRRA